MIKLVYYKRLKFKGHENYRVGSDGSIWESLNGGWVGVRTRPMKRSGHLSVSLRTNGRSRKHLLHRLILEAFIGPCPEGMECCHFPDRDPSNNNLNNLRWDTRKNNHQDRIIHGTNNAGEKNGSAKINRNDVLKIRKLYATGGYYMKEIAVMYGITMANVWCVVRGKSWKHLQVR